MIMRHIHGCLAEAQSSQWRCVYLGLAVLQELLKRGPPELMEETVAGVHFDMVQRLSFLEKYEYGFDKRVQTLIQRRALAMRTSWQERRQEVEGHPCAAEDVSTTDGEASSELSPSSDEAAPATPALLDLLGEVEPSPAAATASLVDLQGNSLDKPREAPAAAMADLLDF
jgi:hypothetical protein